jgi:TPR repeat protein
VAKDVAEANKWFRKAAEQGLAEAQFNLGVSYELRSGVPDSPSGAIEWYYRAAGSFLKKGDRGRALTCYDRMKALEPSHSLTRQLYSELYRAQAKGQPKQ